MAAALAAGTVIPRDADGSGLPVQRPEASTPQPLDIAQFQPRSMLRVPETSVPRAKYPVIDIHTHLTFQERSGAVAGQPRHPCARAGIRAASCDGSTQPPHDGEPHGRHGSRPGDQRSRVPGRAPRPLPDVHRAIVGAAQDPGYAQFQADEIAAAHEAGARGLKVLKTLGLYLREHGTKDRSSRSTTRGSIRCGRRARALGMPVAIHIADPEAFFLPIDRFNERFEELNAHPDWSFHGTRLPAIRRAARGARPRLRAPPEDDVHRAARRPSRRKPRRRRPRPRPAIPNMHVELGARIGELGRQPRTARRFFDRYQDRILFGTDAVAARHRDAAAGLRRRALRDLLSASSRPRTSTSTTRPRRSRRRAAGASTASGCPRRSSRRSTARMPRECCACSVAALDLHRLM